MTEETGRAPLELYVESLRARLPAAQFIVLMRAFHACLSGETGGAVGLTRPRLTPDEQELFTPEIQSEMVALLTLAGAAPFASAAEPAA
ncbi:hypothetical protein [Streptomyces litchfieldiae]|uniref:Uncharacterized protein n=1 Tax=Streptomyces litchfieldiae TaxID=3075543 RepID=A0ABU2MSV5_9ACTN|nr:hypothetical protein [Streptomyces sp. DSM 44938]MDT0344717.1 hypothetical protein [Streptomyces sp. DSM 44938]